ncbi:MAG: hypothetical protein JKY48_08230 [Flavobacteriales bacterium]|nr:hypothetical protein [Flavobacteriales bacterium]
MFKSKEATIASDLEITVEVAPEQSSAERDLSKKGDKTTWENIMDLFTENLLTFLASLFAMFFGYLLFIIRRKLKKKTGYDKTEKES